MKYIFGTSLTALFLISSLCFATDLPVSEMNGYRFESFKGFETKWKLVTVRYRKDTSEMRFTYANDLAWKTLKSGKVNYPDGAIFAKIGLMTQDDPAFSSSACPSGAKRYQFMIKNKKRHPETDGWGYALFDFEGKIFPENSTDKTMACVACHRLVAERGYVFSEAMDLSPGHNTGLSKSFQSKVIFESVSASSLPESIAKNLPPHTDSVRSVTGDISKYLFQGTLDEIRPLLAKEANSSKHPAILINSDKTRFSIVYLNPIDQSCKKEKENAMMSIMSKLVDTSAKPQVNLSAFCYDKNN
jgi:hypothetical protein